jgi:hypothetical protein
MKPWGCQICWPVCQAFFPARTPLRPAAEGCAGGKKCLLLTSVARGIPVPPCRNRFRDALDYSGCGTSRLTPCRPSNLDTPRRPFVRTSSVTAGYHHGSTKLRADATGSLRRSPRRSPPGSLRPRLPPLLAPAQAEVGTTSSRHGALSRSIAHSRTSSRRASATIACFLRAFPRLSRS